jgi:hypothetical protein
MFGRLRRNRRTVSSRRRRTLRPGIGFTFAVTDDDVLHDLTYRVD